MFPKFSILTPTPMLGYGYPLEHFWHGIHTYKPSAIIVDSGSTDPGPYLLGTGVKLCSKASYIRDLTPLLDACHQYGTKLLVSSAGGDGTNAHVDELIGFINEICEAKHYKFKALASIYSEIEKQWVKEKFKLGGIHPCSSAPQLRDSDIEASKVIVAQMGMEPYLKMLETENPDIIVAGRSYDPAPFAAWCVHNGVDISPAWHMGKIMECGGLCALPKGSAMIAIMDKNSFDLVPLNPIERCTPLSVAAHTLYEKTRPDRLPGPGGILHLDNAKYEQLSDGRTTRVSGSVFVPSTTYQVKLEGVSLLGFRTIFIGGVRDPILIAGLDDFLKTVRNKTEIAFPELVNEPNIKLGFHIYGRDAVMGPLEPTPIPAHEIGILGEVLAPTQETASSIAGFARTMCLHCSYENQVATAGNYASPLTPLEQQAGEVYRFSIYHVMDITNEAATNMFKATVTDVGSTHSAHCGNGNGVHQSRELTGAPAPILKKHVPKGAAPLNALAKIIRSKNSGPFELTLDVLFDDPAVYRRARNSDALSRETIKRLYHVEDDDIVVLMFFEPALAWKCTLKRPWEQGSYGERDTFGAQQHAPLLSIVIP